MTVWLGIDVGTQSVRCVATDHGGRTVAAGTSGLRGHRDGVRHEQAPRDWWTALVAACQQAMAGLGDRPVRGVALCATSGTVLLTDASGSPLTPGLMYDDARAVAEADRAVAEGAALWAALGYRPQPSWALPKLVWLLANTPDRPAGSRLAHQADYLTGLLTGAPTAADASHALKTGYDLDAERWPHDVLSALDVPAELLPEVVRPGTPIGTVAAHSPTGIPAGTPVIAGMTDGCAALLGAGTIEVGSWNTVLGTTLVVKGVTAHRPHDPLGVVYSHRGPGDTWLPGGASSVGAGALTAEFGGRDLAELDARCARRPHTTASTYPLVSPGERFPFAAPAARAINVGAPGADPGDELDRYAAILRGVAFTERLCLDYLDLLGAPVDGPLSLTGGGARSRYWCQVRADTLGRQVRVPRDADPATGMALVARAAGGSLTEVARDLVRDHELFDPDPASGEVLTEGYLALVGALRDRGWLPGTLADHATTRSAR